MRPSNFSPFGLAAVCTSVLLGCAALPTQRLVFPSTKEEQAPGVVLMVLSAAAEQTLSDGRTRETGYFLNEFYEPYKALIGQGYQIAIATPGGRAPAVDPESLNLKYWSAPQVLADARALIASLPQLREPLRLEDVRLRSAEFQGLVVPGGQGVMVDLLESADLHTLLADFGASDRPVGLVCHAPSLLARLPNSLSSFRGRRVTSVSGFEEWYIETFVMGARAQVRAIGKQLDAAGFLHVNAFPGRSFAVRSCNLVTSQNPYSGAAFDALMLEALKDWRQGGRCELNDEHAR